MLLLLLVVASSFTSSIILTTPQQALAATNCDDLSAVKTSAQLEACLKADTSPYAKLGPAQKVRAYITGQALGSCFANASLNGMSPGSGYLYPEEAQAGGWFNGYGAHIGAIYLGNSDVYATANCSDTEFIKNALGTLGWSDPATALCDFGFTRDSGDCMTGSGNFNPPGDGAARVRLFNEALQRKLYGSNPITLSPYLKYVWYEQTFMSGCTPTVAGSGAAVRRVTLNSVDASGKLKDVAYEIPADRGEQYLYENYAGDYILESCEWMVQQANEGSDNGKKGQYKDDYAAYMAMYAGLPEDVRAQYGQQSGGGCSTGLDENGNCLNEGNDLAECGGGGLSWMICPIIQLAGKAAQAADNLITSQLDIETDGIFKTCDNGCETQNAYYQAWNSFRIIATAILIIAGLFMIISTALGFEFLDAYTIRKTLPRLAIAVIGISLSWPLMEFVVNFFNVLGLSVRGLIYGPFEAIQGTIDVTVGLGSYLAVAGLALAMGFASLTLILTALLAMFVGFVIIVIRHLAIIVLVIIAPVAIACYVLPNTQKVWKLWRDNFMGLLMMFPIISAFIAAGHVFAAVSFADGAETTGVTQIIGLVAYFAPYFLLPVAFRLATGVIGTIAGFVNDRNRGVFDRLKKTRGNSLEKHGAHYKDKYGTKVQQARASAFRNLNRRASQSGRVGGAALRFAARRVEGIDNIEAGMSALNARRAKEINDTIATGLDGEVRGLTVNRAAARNSLSAAQRASMDSGANFNENDSSALVRRRNGTLEYKSLGGGWVNEADVVNGQKRWKGDRSAQQTALSYEMRKAMSEEDVEGLKQRYVATARDSWGMAESDAQGAWIGAGFENQNKNLSFKNTDVSYGQGAQSGAAQLNGGKLLKEAYYKKGSYPLSQMDSETIRRMDDAHTDAVQRSTSARAALSRTDLSAAERETYTRQANSADQDIQYARGIAETFMRDMGSGAIRDDGGEVVGVQPGAPGSSRRQAGGNGAAAVNETVRQFAQNTGILGAPPTRPSAPGQTGGGNNIPRSTPGSSQTNAE